MRGICKLKFKILSKFITKIEYLIWEISSLSKTQVKHFNFCFIHLSWHISWCSIWSRAVKMKIRLPVCGHEQKCLPFSIVMEEGSLWCSRDFWRQPKYLKDISIGHNCYNNILLKQEIISNQNMIIFSKSDV